MRQSPTSTPSKFAGGARPPVEIWIITSGSRSLTKRHVSRNLSTRIVGLRSSFLEWMWRIDTPNLMHSCIWSAISCGEHLCGNRLLGRDIPKSAKILLRCSGTGMLYAAHKETAS